MGVIAIKWCGQLDLRERHTLMVRIDAEVLCVDSRLRLEEIVDGSILLHHDDDIFRKRELSALRRRAGANWDRGRGISHATSVRRSGERAFKQTTENDSPDVEHSSRDRRKPLPSDNAAAQIRRGIHGRLSRT